VVIEITERKEILTATLSLKPNGRIFDSGSACHEKEIRIIKILGK
jgi:hypothetical protein